MKNNDNGAKIPMACSPNVFSRAELDAHVSRSLDVLFRLPTHVEERADGFDFHYQGKDELFLELAQFAFNEHRCCPWESFAIEMEPFEFGKVGALRLRYTGGIEGKAMLTEAFEQFRLAAHDPDAERRLRAAFRRRENIAPESMPTLYREIAGEPERADESKSSSCC